MFTCSRHLLLLALTADMQPLVCLFRWSLLARGLSTLRILTVSLFGFLLTTVSLDYCSIQFHLIIVQYSLLCARYFVSLDNMNISCPFLKNVFSTRELHFRQMFREIFENGLFLQFHSVSLLLFCPFSFIAHSVLFIHVHCYSVSQAFSLSRIHHLSFYFYVHSVVDAAEMSFFAVRCFP